MLQGLAAALAIVLFVTAHEAGHFLAAKAVGMKATEFFFGFGPKLWSFRRGETEYGFKLLPLGGYVRIIGMNPLEEVAPEDLGRTYREKRFWEKSVVVLAGVGMNFLIAFLMFWAVIQFNGIAERYLPVVERVVDEVAVGEETVPTPAAQAGLRPGDEILSIDGRQVDSWEDVPAALQAAGAGPSQLVLERDGDLLTISVDLIAVESPDGSGITPFLGVSPAVEMRTPGVFEAIGIAGTQVWDGIGFTFRALGDMIKPSSLAQYFAVFTGDVEIDEEIRPVSPIGLVNIGSQADSAVTFFGVLGFVNVILATLNLLPLFPLDGGHFAVALYEKVTGREANIRRLIPVAAAVIGLFVFLGFVAIILDIVNPISLPS